MSDDKIRFRILRTSAYNGGDRDRSKDVPEAIKEANGEWYATLAWGEVRGLIERIGKIIVYPPVKGRDYWILEIYDDYRE